MVGERGVGGRGKRRWKVMDETYYYHHHHHHHQNLVEMSSHGSLLPHH